MVEDHQRSVDPANPPEAQGTLGIDSLMEVYGKRLDNEHSLIASRMGWLLTLNSFLVAILGVGLANSETIGPHQWAFWLILTGSTVGGICNASCLFSNYWGGRAIDEASQQVTRELGRIFGSSTDPYPSDVNPVAGLSSGESDSFPGHSATNVDGQPATPNPDGFTREGKRWLARLRLYGRDPHAEPERVGFWRPPSVVLHPWYTIPTVFVLLFSLLPIALAASWTLSWGHVVASLIAALVPVALIALAFTADFFYDQQRSGLRVREFRKLSKLRKQKIKRDAAGRRRVLKADLEAEISRLTYELRRPE